MATYAASTGSAVRHCTSGRTKYGGLEVSGAKRRKLSDLGVELCAELGLQIGAGVVSDLKRKLSAGNSVVPAGPTAPQPWLSRSSAPKGARLRFDKLPRCRL